MIGHWDFKQQRVPGQVQVKVFHKQIITASHNAVAGVRCVCRYTDFGMRPLPGRLRERLLPVRASEIVATVRDTLHLKIAHDDLTTYNAVQKVLYILAILGGVAQVITGLAIWKPVQFSGLLSLLGGFQSARLLHFAGMTGLVGFLVIHVALALLVPKTLWAMLAGGPRLPLREARR